jgi:hypothetical protein
VVSPKRSPSAERAVRTARLLDRSAALQWRGYQFALVHVERERAHLLEDRARQLEELAEAVRVHAWEPKITPSGLSPAERAELQLILADRMVAARSREKLAASARQARHADEPHGARYVQIALEREAAAVAAAPVGVRNETLSRSAWSLARFVCDGLVHGGEVLDALVPAARAAGLPGREAHACVRAALRRRCVA